MIRALAIAIFGALAIGCVASPLIYSALGAPESPPPWPYSRVFDRVAMLALLVLLIALRRHVAWGRVGETFRAGSRGTRARAFGLGFLLSTATALAVVPLLVAGGRMTWAPVDAGVLSLKLLEAVPAAILVSILEESFFRVLVFDGLRARMHAVTAAVGCSLFYGALHFLAPAKDFVYPGWSPLIGFEYLARILSRFGLPAVLAGILGLFLIGLTLCWTIRRTGSIWLCIGLHAGWFLVAKLAVYIAEVAPGSELPRGVNERYFLVGRPWTWLSVIAVFAVLWALRRRLALRLPPP